jgi:hypothetical protein
MDTSPTPTDLAGASAPIETVNACPSCSCGKAECLDVSANPDRGVGARLHDRLTRTELRDLSDAALDAYIRQCIEGQNQAQTRWLADGSLSHAGERDGWMLAEHEARDHRTVRAELARGRM